MTRPKHVYQLDDCPPPAWLCEARAGVRYMALPTYQEQAAHPLLAGIESEAIPAPYVQKVVAQCRCVASFGWVNGDRAVVAIPVMLAGRLHVELTIWADGRELWVGWPAEAVGVLRGMLAWTYQDR